MPPQTLSTPAREAGPTGSTSVGSAYAGSVRVVTVPPPARRGSGVRLDRMFWLGCAVFALLVTLVTDLTPHRVWGACAAVGYGVAALVAHRSPRPWGRRATVSALLGALVAPLVLLMATGAAQPEVHVVEHSATLLLHSGSPYVPHPVGVDDYNPYLPGMALFGIPHALFGSSPLADARVWFLAAFLGSMPAAGWWAAGRGARVEGRATRTGGRTGRIADGMGRADAALLLAAFPAVALPLAVGGVDLPVIGLMCLGLALAGRGGTGATAGLAAGLAMGAAAALKWTAWPLLPVGLALLAVTAGRRAAVRAGVGAVLVAAAAVVPVALADPHAFVEHVVLFPLGQGDVRSPATSPLPGHLLAAYVPGGSVLAMGALGVAAVAVAVSLVVRPPRTVVAAADRLALGLGIAMCLIPATRFGYLVYPLVLALWFRVVDGGRAVGAPAGGTAAAVAVRRLVRRVGMGRG
jgi:hypothetical protein